MPLRYKFVLLVNLILVLVLGASLAWEWRRQQATGLALLRTRLDEEARFVHAAYRSLGATGHFGAFLRDYCHAVDAPASPEHQVAVLDEAGALVASAAEHARRPMDPRQLAALAEGFWSRRNHGESYLIRVSTDGGRRVVVAESTRAIRDRVWTNLRGQAIWPLSTGVLLLIAINAAMGRAVLRPVRRLHRAARLIGQGQLGTQVEIDFDGDELGALSRQFNAMSRTLAEEAEANRREMETARRVQAHLLPPPELRLGPVQVAGRCLPAAAVGGDVYDVRTLPGGGVGVLVADLSGHNVAAALHTAMLRAIVWHEAEQAQDPGTVLTRLNDGLCRDLAEEHFATAFFGWFDPHAGRLHYANAGHPPAYFLPPGGAVQELGPNGPLLGVVPEVVYPTEVIDVAPDSLLLVYSDGLTEAHNPRGDLWGAGELVEHLASGGSRDPRWIVARILDRCEAFRLGTRQMDDVTVVVCRFVPAGAGAVDPVGPEGAANGRLGAESNADLSCEVIPSK